MTFCAAPFVHMVQNPDGQFRTCCMYEKPLSGKYANIKEAFDSQENKIIRQRIDERISAKPDWYRKTL